VLLTKRLEALSKKLGLNLPTVALADMPGLEKLEAAARHQKEAVRRRESAASGISSTMHCSSDLVAWHNENATPTLLLQNTKTGYAGVEVTYPRPAEEAALFHRLLRTLHPEFNAALF
jgi:hypothetical protein